MTDDQNRPGGANSSVTVQEAAQALEDGNDAMLIDVREMNEYVQLRAGGTVFMPLAAVAARFTELPQDRTLLMICRSGARSGQATRFLQLQGFADVRNVEGGMIAWKNAGLATKSGPLDPGEGDL